MTRPRTAVLTWDWREQPNLDRLAQLVAVLSGGGLHLRQVDTGSDEHAVVLCTTWLGPEQARQAYERYLADGASFGEVPGRPHRLDAAARRQGVQPVADPAELAGPPIDDAAEWRAEITGDPTGPAGPYLYGVLRDCEALFTGRNRSHPALYAQELRRMIGDLRRALAAVAPRDPGDDRPTVAWRPDQCSGQPTIAGTGISVEAVGGSVWAGEGLDRAGADYDLTVPQVLVACWWLGTHGTRAWRRRWGGWAERVSAELWLGQYEIPDPPARA